MRLGFQKEKNCFESFGNDQRAKYSLHDLKIFQDPSKGLHSYKNPDPSGQTLERIYRWGKNKDQLAVPHLFKIALLVDRSSQILTGFIWQSRFVSNETPANRLHEPPFLCNSSGYATVWQPTHTEGTWTLNIHKVCLREGNASFSCWLSAQLAVSSHLDQGLELVLRAEKAVRGTLCHQPGRPCEPSAVPPGLFCVRNIKYTI